MNVISLGIPNFHSLLYNYYISLLYDFISYYSTYRLYIFSPLP